MEVADWNELSFQKISERSADLHQHKLRNLSGIYCYRLSFLTVNTWLFNNAYFSNGSQIFFLSLRSRKNSGMTILLVIILCMSKNKRGKFIVIEGIDGSGKATQTKLLIKRLKKEGRKTATLDFPQYYNNFFGKMTGRYLAGEFGTADEVSPYLASVLYALDRWESKDFILKQLAVGKIVVCDRYASSNIIHQGGKIKPQKKRGELIKWLEKMEFDVLKISKPDLIIYLDVPHDVGQKLVDKKDQREYIKGRKRDIHERDSNHLKNARSQALRMVKQNKNWIKINCLKNGRLLNPEEIGDLVWGAVRTFI